MKKIIGFLGVAAFAGVMFLNTISTINTNTEDGLKLTSLLLMNKADAECTDPICENHYTDISICELEGGFYGTIATCHPLPFSGTCYPSSCF